jgi:hypothetical protein
MRKTEQRRNSIWRGHMVAGIAMVAAVLVGCATPQTGSPPRVMQPDDFKMLAGPWTGSTDIQSTLSTNLKGVIQDTGAYITTPGGPGFMRIVDGGVVYESPTSKGKMTFHENPTEWVWKWDGVTPDGRWVRNVLTKSK